MEIVIERNGTPCWIPMQIYKAMLKGEKFIQTQQTQKNPLKSKELKLYIKKWKRK
jgi:hypothetical protein